jgi:hypothetical protein
MELLFLILEGNDWQNTLPTNSVIGPGAEGEKCVGQSKLGLCAGVLSHLDAEKEAVATPVT